MKPVLQLAAIGIIGIGLWKLASLFLLPLFFFIFKIGLIIGLVMLVYWWINKKSRGKEDTPPATE
jgi:hypothetical protein